MPQSLVYQLGLVGYPLGHSLSPVLHEALLRQTGQVGRYTLWPVPPHALDEQLARLQQTQGFNVTIPHKQAVFQRLHRLSHRAQLLQAVNTVRPLPPDGRWEGHNTDWEGFWTDLPDGVQQTVPQRPAVVLGAGGSARAVLAALVAEGCPAFTLVVRNPQRAQETLHWLEKQLKPALQANPAVHLIRLDEQDALVAALQNCGLLVNTTPVGMAPAIEQCPVKPALLDHLPADAAVYDLIYNPLETALVQAAQARGLLAKGGLGMLVRQGAAAFTLWTGQPVDPDLLTQLDTLLAQQLQAK